MKVPPVARPQHSPDHVADAVAAVYRALSQPVEMARIDDHAEAATRSDAGWVIYLRDQRVAEWVVPDAQLLHGLRATMEQLEAAGWCIRAVVPVSDLGAGHATLRGLRAELQGWWSDDARELRFSLPQMA